jgi:hypothetical protein
MTLARRAWPLLAVLLALGCAKPAPPADEAARLIAQMKAASGGAALDKPAGFHEIGMVNRDGSRGTYEIWADLRTLRSAGKHTFNDQTITTGFDGKTAWAMAPDGTVRTDTTAEGLAVSRLGAYLTAFGFFYPDRFPAKFESRGRKELDGASYDVVTVTPEGSIPADLWIDTKTHRLQRITGTAGTTSFTGKVLRYEVVDGIWVPFALLQTEGERQMEQDVMSVTYEEIPAHQFSPPMP